MLRLSTVRDLDLFLGRKQIEFQGAKARRSQAAFRRAAKSLSENGVVVFREFYKPSHIDACAAEAREFAERVERWRGASREDEAEEGICLRTPKMRVKRGYGRLIHNPKTVIAYRDGADAGLVDIFHPERLLKKSNPIFRDRAKEEFVKRLVEQATGAPMRTLVRNFYVNNAVSRTRDFHVDGWALKAKAFLYLTDVAIEDGPYCYACGTHNARHLRAVNKRYNEREGLNAMQFQVFSPRRIATFEGRRGDLIVSFQFGAHRGLPQASHRRRLVAVQTLKPLDSAPAEPRAPWRRSPVLEPLERLASSIKARRL